MLLISDAEDVEPDQTRTVKLYEKAIEQGRDAYTINSLTVVLKTGAGRVRADPRRTVELSCMKWQLHKEVMWMPYKIWKCY